MVTNGLLLVAFIASISTGGAAAAVPRAPAAPVASLAYFLGSWQCNGSFPSSGKAISSKMRFESDLAGSAIVKHHDDVAPSSYHDIEVWSYSNDDKRFNAFVADNFGGMRRFASDGWHGAVLTWSSASDVTPIQQFVYTRLTADSMRVDWQISKDGTHYVVGDTLTCSKSSR